MQSFKLTVSFDLDEPLTEERVREFVTEALYEHWGWFGMAGDQRIEVVIGHAD